MAIVLKSSHRWRVWLTHLVLIVFIALTMWPFLMILSISLRPGNFAGGSLIPASISFEHWKLALGISYLDADGHLVKPPFPVLLWIWNSLKVSFISATISSSRSTPTMVSTGPNGSSWYRRLLRGTFKSAAGAK